MEPFATVDELQARLDFTMDDGERGVAQGALEDLTLDAMFHAGKEWTPQDVPIRVKSLVLRAAKRYMTNPDGLIQSRAGDETLVYTDLGERAGSAYFTPEEIKQLEEIGRVPKIGFGTIGFYTWGKNRPTRDGLVPMPPMKDFPFFAKEDGGL